MRYPAEGRELQKGMARSLAGRTFGAAIKYSSACVAAFLDGGSDGLSGGGNLQRVVYGGRGDSHIYVVYIYIYINVGNFATEKLKTLFPDARVTRILPRILYRPTTRQGRAKYKEKRAP